jgi:hypothetical protein
VRGREEEDILKVAETTREGREWEGGGEKGSWEEGWNESTTCA